LDPENTKRSRESEEDSESEKTSKRVKLSQSEDNGGKGSGSAFGGSGGGDNTGSGSSGPEVSGGSASKISFNDGVPQKEQLGVILLYLGGIVETIVDMIHTLL
jgi:hypothetical protein